MQSLKELLELKLIYQRVILLTLWVINQGSTHAIVQCEYNLEQEWDTGFLGKVSIPIAEQYSNGWILLIRFSSPVRDFDVFEAETVNLASTLVPQNNKDYICENKDYNHVIYYYKDKIIHLYLEGKQYPTDDRSVYIPPPNAEAIFIPHKSPSETVMQALTRAANTPDEDRYPMVLTRISSTTSPTTTLLTTTSTKSTTRLPWFGWKTEPPNPLSTTIVQQTTPTMLKSTTAAIPVSRRFRYNLRDVIKKSLLFFEAQRSGKLPTTNRIPWRSHSALRDGMDKGLDLTGGYYTDGSHIKYGFPTASSITLLAWGAIQFKRGYVAAKELGNLLAAIKWGTDYLLKCHTDTFSLVGQVSDSKSDNSAWSRPEDMRGVRPSYKITRNKPGSDLAAEVSAAFAAASVVLRETNPDYALSLKNHSEQLFRFADRYRGKYHVAIKDAADQYKSTGYFDELAWAAAWLYGITNDKSYLSRAKMRLSQNQDKSPITRLDWNDKRIAAVTLLAQLTNRTEYRLTLRDFCNSMLIGGGHNYTHKGLLFLDSRGTTSLASNSGFICLMAANLGLRPETFRTFSQTQLNYILGDSGRSYVIGFGKQFPKNPYHKASSCPKMPLQCTWRNMEYETDNPHQLTGALVNGPDIWDNFSDKRNSLSNRVNVYFNAGFQTLAAGILQLQVSMMTFSDPEPGELLPTINQNFEYYHDYSQVLRYSLMFYEAQRSGQLTDNNRIHWRKSACTSDKGSSGNSLSGGYFDGGDYIKFNFPMAFTTTVLAWGTLMYPQSYKNAGEDVNMENNLKWATDYFLKCHTSKNELYGQIGSGALEHGHWLRPEDINYLRPAFKITKKYPGSELAGETSAALAASAAIFKVKRPQYAKLLIKHAKELYQFAVTHRGFYHRSITDAAQVYPSLNGYKDEIVWACIWIYIATGETSYLNDAKAKYAQYGLGNKVPVKFYWDDKTAGINVLLARLTKSQKYMSVSEKFCDQFRYAKYTPRGLLYQSSLGPLQYASGAALICMITADLGIKPAEYRKFAKQQIHYILGDSGLGSYVVGYGPSPPKQPHHRSSSCPVNPVPCNFTALYSQSNNPHVLYGAVVGGPDDKDQFVDDRSNVRSNRVALVYNAAFQSAVAALKYIQMFPPPTPETTTLKPRKTTKKTMKLSQPQTTSYRNTTPVTTVTENITVSVTTNVSTLPSSRFSTYFTSQFVQPTTISFFHTTTMPDIQTVTVMKPVISKEETLAVLTTIAVNSNITSKLNNSESKEIKNPNYRFCGRIRALQLFDNCAIPSKQYEYHKDKIIYRCRYQAFKACVDVQTDECPDSVWEYWPYWNHNVNDSLYFSDEDIGCKDQNTLAVERCEIRGMTWTFDICHRLVEEWNTTHDTEGNCRWMKFGNCVMKHLDHCSRTWHIWKLYNMGLPQERQFAESDMECLDSSAVRLEFRITLDIFVVYSYLLYYFILR